MKITWLQIACSRGYYGLNSSEYLLEYFFNFLDSLKMGVQLQNPPRQLLSSFKVDVVSQTEQISAICITVALVDCSKGLDVAEDGRGASSDTCRRWSSGLISSQWTSVYDGRAWGPS